MHRWQVTGNEFFPTITEEVLDYMVRGTANPIDDCFSQSTGHTLK
jgi:hypothetical protein